MANPKPWLKLWAEWIDDPKMNRLHLAQQAAWWRLVTLAHRCSAGGPLVHGNGLPLTLDEIADALRCGDRHNRKVFDAMVANMIDKESLHWQNETLVVTNLKKRQETAATATAEAVRDRVREFRERQRKEKESDKEKERLEGEGVSVKEGEGESNVLHLVTPSGSPGSDVTRNPLQGDKVMAEVCALYEQNIGQLPKGGVVIEDMLEFTENYRGGVEWIKLAFKEALGRNKRRWQYIRSILERWQDEGGPDGRAGEELERQQRGAGGKPTGDGVGRGHSPSGAKESGWKVIESDEPGAAEPGDQS